MRAKKPLGKALRRTAADLERLSQITPNDVDRARRLWQDKAPEQFKGLIDARPEPPTRPA